MALFPLLSLQEVLLVNAENRRECADVVLRCRFEIKETKTATEGGHHRVTVANETDRYPSLRAAPKAG
jgi:hypothetical protein